MSSAGKTATYLFITLRISELKVLANATYCQSKF